MPDVDDELTRLRARVSGLEAALNQQDDALASAYNLPSRMSDLLGLLLNMAVVPPEVIQERLGIASEAKVAVCRLRNHLAPYNIQVQVRRGQGYWLSDAAKIQIRDAIGASSESTNGAIH